MHSCTETIRMFSLVYMYIARQKAPLSSSFLSLSQSSCTFPFPSLSSQLLLSHFLPFLSLLPISLPLPFLVLPFPFFSLARSSPHETAAFEWSMAELLVGRSIVLDTYIELNYGSAVEFANRDVQSSWSRVRQSVCVCCILYQC